MWLEIYNFYSLVYMRFFLKNSLYEICKKKKNLVNMIMRLFNMIISICCFIYLSGLIKFNSV